MNSRILLPAALLILSVPLSAGVRVRETHVQPIAAVDTDPVREGERGPRVNAIIETNAEPSAAMSVYPVAGTLGRDLAIP